ncbi:hypothetical protein EV207_14018 [Scopulibacillus darangshiensis]|uniref:Uncharacterized protein n=1 Tax=Scopulibacillus darangshiensis TaxID=442528 RepID=A0A4R2NJH5_9BACL|nr:hypothetical protein [Scopulibacillus darangshiensis]TCP21709.1 hypothetical protein EV207_14018 [Scopulibacillus darangshiensis]
MISWFFYLSLTNKILFGIAGLAVIFLYVFWLNSYIFHVHQKTKSPEHTLQQVKFFNKYLYLLLVFLDFILNNLLIWTQLSRVLYDYPYLVVYMSLLAAFFVFLLIIMINQQISFNVSKEIRGFTVTRKDKLGKTIRVLSMLFIFLVVICFIAYGLVSQPFGDFYNGYGFMVLFVLVILCISLLTPLLFGKVMDVEPLVNQELKQRLQNYVKKEGIQNVSFYTFQSKQKRKKNNVIVTGYRKKYFYFAEDHFNDLTMKQLESLVACGIGQIKQRHSLIRNALLLFSLFPLYGVAYFINWYENVSWVIVPVFTTVLIYVICLVLYSRVLLPFIFRIMERKADQYVLNQGVDYRDFATALLKVKELKGRPRKVKRLMDRRVKWIIQKSGGSWEEVERHQDDLNKGVAILEE